MTSRQVPSLTSTSHGNYPAMVGGLPSLQPQLAMYAEDFQELFGRHNELQRHHENLKASHSRLTEVGEVLGRLTSSSNELCLVIEADGHIKYASDSARSVFIDDERGAYRA